MFIKVSILFCVLGAVLYAGASIAERILRAKNKKEDE